jgi:amidohydrolase
MQEWLSRTRRNIHMNPETAFEEFETTELIRKNLNEMGVELVNLPGMTTGAAGLIRGRAEGRTLALRADIDALSLTELNQVPYKSGIDGRMHACGHDAHTAILLGVARKMIEEEWSSRIKGTLKLIFQPAEETASGASRMIEAGIMKNPAVDRIVALHVNPDLQVGQVGLIKGISHAAADFFRLEIRGSGGHGGRPNETVDPIVAGAHFVSAAQTIVARNIDPLDSAVLSVGKFQAGATGNVIPDQAVLEGTVRTFSGQGRDLIIGRLKEMVDGLERSFGVRVEYEFKPGVPAVVNDDQVVVEVAAACARVVGAENVLFPNPTMGGEDMAFFNQLVPGACIRLGCANPSRNLSRRLHSPHFDLDEDALMIGVDIYTAIIMDYLVSHI